MIQIQVIREYTIDFDGSAEDYIRLANNLTDQGLDSLDLGDATGAILEKATFGPNSFGDHLTYDSFATGKTQHCHVIFDREVFRYTHGSTGVGATLTEAELTCPTGRELLVIHDQSAPEYKYKGI